MLLHFETYLVRSLVLHRRAQRIHRLFYLHRLVSLGLCSSRVCSQGLSSIPISGATANGPLAVPLPSTRPLPIASPLPRPPRPLTACVLPLSFAALAAEAASLSRSLSSKAFNSSALRRTIFGLNRDTLLLPLVPPLIELPLASGPSADSNWGGGGRMGVGAGVSVGCVRGESLGSRSTAVEPSF